MNITNKIDLYRQRFVMRSDAYATMAIKNDIKIFYTVCVNWNTEGCLIKQGRGTCANCSLKVRAQVTDDVIGEHIKGTSVHGFYLLSRSGMCQAAAVDLDEEHTFNALEDLVFLMKKYRLHPYAASSTSKGWHIYLFFEKPVRAEKIRFMLHHICDDALIKPFPEIFPKQSSSNDLGNCIRLPLTEPDVQKGRCAFLNPERLYEALPLEDQWMLLKSVTPDSEQTIDEIVESFEYDHLDRKIKDLNNGQYPPILKPCIRQVIRDEASQGQRNMTGLMIVVELNRLGNNRDQILGVAAAWNLRNRTPLDNAELIAIINSGLAHEYSYGCRSEEVRETIGCIGYDKCGYYQEFLQTNRCDSRSSE